MKFGKEDTGRRRRKEYVGYARGSKKAGNMGAYLGEGVEGRKGEELAESGRMHIEERRGEGKDGASRGKKERRRTGSK